MAKASVYLIEKAESLKKVIDFFSKGNGSTGLHERYMIFLAQMDFWEWEVENLIYSYQNFKERSRVWTNSEKMLEGLYNAGFAIKASAYAKWCNHTNDVEAPVELLEEVIGQWNVLVEKAVKAVAMNEDEAKKNGIKVADPKKYMKKLEKQ